MNLQEDAKNIFIEAIKACDISKLLSHRLVISDKHLHIDDKEIQLSKFTDILLIGFGKASIDMGVAVEEILGGRLKQGILVTNRSWTTKTKSEILIAGHPLPNTQSLKAAIKIREAIRSSSEKTLIIFVISGGGSSLLELPLLQISIEDIQTLNYLLVTSGATISEINLIRKYISQIKGGKLAKELGRRKGIAIYLSDVNSDDLSTIASGPLIPTVITQAEVLELLEKYNLMAKVPVSVLEVIQKEKSNPGSVLNIGSENLTHLLLADNRQVMDAASVVALQKGYHVELNSDFIEGEYRSVADELIFRLHKLVKKFPHDKICLISGGEVSCAVKGKGIGGRNQEFVLYSASKLSELNFDFESAVLSAGSDGIDGVSIASGAVMTRQNLNEIRQDLLADNDSHSLINQCGGLIVLGPTGNNIRDLRLHLAMPVVSP